MRKGVLLLLLLSSITFAQLVQTNGPEGANIEEITAFENAVYFKTTRNNIFRYADKSWEQLTGLYGANDLTMFKEALYYTTYEGVYYGGNNGEVAEQVLAGKPSAFYGTENALYVAINDTIYTSENGTDWDDSIINLETDFDTTGTSEDERLTFINNFAVRDSTIVVGGFLSNFALLKTVFVSGNLGDTWQSPEEVDYTSNLTDLGFFGDDIFIVVNTAIYRSRDMGVRWELLDEGFPEDAYIRSLVSSSDGIYALAGHPGRLYKLNEETWVETGADVEAFTVAALGNSIYFYGPEGVGIYDTETKQVTDITSGLIATSTTPFVVSEDKVFAMGGGKLSVTTDGGNTWEYYKEYPFNSMAAGDGIIAAAKPGKMFISDDAGASWIEVTGSGISSDRMASLTSVAASDGVLFASFAKSRRRDHLSGVWVIGGVYRSTDNGVSWRQASSGLPRSGSVYTPVYRFYTAEGQIIANSSEGMYRSTNGGESWHSFEGGLPEYTFSTEFLNYNGKLFSLTNNGIFYSDVSSGSWIELSGGLDFEDNTFYYQSAFAESNGNIYLLTGGEEPIAYKLEEETWVEQDIDLPEGIIFNEVVNAGNILYAGTVESGIWKGTLEKTTGVYTQEIPEDYSLSQNYPNPFNPSTKIDFTLAEDSDVNLVIYDILGNRVSTLSEGRLSAGRHVARFDAAGIASGVYLYELTVAGTDGNLRFSKVRKMMLLK